MRTVIFFALFQFHSFCVVAQNASAEQVKYVESTYSGVKSLISDYENNKIKKVEFINQLYIILSDTSKKISQGRSRKSQFEYPKYLVDYMYSNDFKVFKSPPPIYNGNFFNHKDSLRYEIYRGLNYLYSMNNNLDTSHSKFIHIDSIIKIAEFINNDTTVKFTAFSLSDRNKINKLYLDCLVLRDEYYDAKELGYDRIPPKAKLAIRENYKGRSNYLQYFDYLDQLKR